MIAVLLAAADVEPPRLDVAPRRRRDVDVAPRWRHPQRIDAREHATISNDPIIVVHIAKARALRADPAEPAIGHTRAQFGKKETDLVRFSAADHRAAARREPPRIPPRSTTPSRSTLMPDHLLLSVEERIATLTVNRPEKLNALNASVIGALGEAIDDLRDRDDVAGIILTGAGRAFIAGADISELTGLTARAGQTLAQRGQEVFRRFETSPKPVIAAVNGFALGGGCELAMACHIRIASEAAKFGQPEVKLGVIPGYGGTQRLARLVGKGRALQLVLTGEMVDAAEAYRIGLVNRVVPGDQLLPAARTLMQQVLANAPLALAACIDVVDRGLEIPLNEATALEAMQFGVLLATEDTAEGTRAFLEKRTPRFRGA